jgi:BppU N-terminal domain
LRNVFTFDVDIKLKMLIKEPTVVQNDDIRFIINVFDNGQPLDLTNVETVSLANVRLDGQTIVTPGTKIDTNIVQFDLGTEETKVSGRVVATAQFYDSEGRVSTISFTYKVVKDPTGDGYIPTENEQTLIETVLNDGPLVIQQAQDAAVYATAQGDYAKQVADENKTRWLTAVNTYADIATAYPNPQLGDTVQTIDDSKIYRWDGTQWVWTQQYNANAITDVQNKIGILTEFKNIKQQIDYTEYLAKSSPFKPKMSVKIEYGTSRVFWVNIAVSDTKGIAYAFRKNANDDYILLMEGVLGDIVPVEAVVETKNYETKTGTFNESFPPNFWTTEVGATISATFKGTRIDFNSYADNRGGIWEFVLDEGTPEEQRKTISTYSSSPVAIKTQTLFSGLDDKKHTIKGIFQGDDPSNPPSTGAGTARGWVYVGGLREQDVDRTFDIYRETFDITKTDDILYSYSNKEFAISCRPFGATESYEFIPEHNNIGTAFKVMDEKLLVDGKEIIWSSGNFYMDVETVQLVQKVNGIHPSYPGSPLMEITTIHTIKNGVVTISGKIKFLQKTEIDKGYAIMIPYFTSFAKKIKTSLNNVYTVITDNPNYKEYWPEEDKVKSLAIINDVDTGEKENLAFTCTIDNFDVTMRNGELYRGDPFSWIEHRNSSMGKIYFQQFQNAVIEAGEEYRFDGRFSICYIPKINQFVL